MVARNSGFAVNRHKLLQLGYLVQLEVHARLEMNWVYFPQLFVLSQTCTDQQQKLKIPVTQLKPFSLIRLHGNIFNIIMKVAQQIKKQTKTAETYVTELNYEIVVHKQHITLALPTILHQ